MIRVVIAALVLVGGPAAASHCGLRSPTIATLQQLHGESLQAIGIDGGGNMIELFANPESGSWTLLVTEPEGATCLAAAGHSFELRRETLPPDEGDPT
ncbi:hypothetical protein [Seohaeicola zhoushanensis]|uniref:Uncharacterized protein n=1 Tax=Seohaeicola zhoushanensis TaxID=1569283 RepID=A0A8J3GTW1_9RHOB|nr:hypothetical protein [Seohaeicola zhoushanensis]GHF33386.1 hypothetical protein GCM10017056_01000 [Seohaeicola zhoushanensis]